MKTYKHKVGNIVVGATVEEILYPQLQALFRCLDEVPFEEIKNGFSIEIGFSLYFLTEKNEGYSIVAPDYTRNPFSDTTEDLTIALLIQVNQVDLLREYGIEWENVRYNEKILIAKNALQERDVFLHRLSNCRKGDSGWCIKSVENADVKDYEAFYAYQLLELRPALLSALALPYGYIIVFEGDNIVEIIDESNMRVDRNRCGTEEK